MRNGKQLYRNPENARIAGVCSGVAEYFGLETLDSTKVDNAMGRFEQYERKIDDLESQVEAYDLGKKTLQDEFAELEASDKVEDELAALKAKVKGANTSTEKSE